MEDEVKYCLFVMENAKARGNTSCQVPIFAKPETLERLAEMGLAARQVGFDATEPYAHVEIRFGSRPS